MNLRNTFIKMVTIVVVVFTFLSCDDEFSPVGSEVIGGVNFQDGTYTATPVAYSKRLERVRTNGLVKEVQGAQANLHANLLGIYNDPIYGQSDYSILSQALPDRLDPTYGDNAVLDSVVLNLPYHSTVDETQEVEVTLEDGTKVTETRTIYVLDSIYGDKPFKFSMYQSNYFLRDFDPTTTERQIYYSNDIQDNFGAEVEDVPLYTDEAFLPSDLEIVLKGPDGDDTDSNPDRTRITPRLRVVFSEAERDDIRAYFETLFLAKEGGIEFSNQDNFTNYFRGLYFKAEPINNDGSLVYFDLADANLTLHYSFDKVDTEDEDGDGSTDDIIQDQGTLGLTFTNNIINSINTEFDPAIAEELKEDNQDSVNGESNIYLKGGAGSFAILDLFNKCVEYDENGGFALNENGGPIFIECPTEPENKKTELDFLKSEDWLVNDTSIKLYINQESVTAGDAEPERIYIFNAETGTVLADYNLDVTLQFFDNDPIRSITNHLGRINRGTDDVGEFYKIKITQHIINLLNDDGDNVKLGLSVSQNVNSVTSVVADTSTPNNDLIVPTSSIISHEGTILFGNGADVPEAKRLKLEIFYTESKKN